MENDKILIVFGDKDRSKKYAFNKDGSVAFVDDNATNDYILDAPNC